MKKLTALILALTLVLGLAACGKEAAPEAKTIDLAALYDNMVDTLPDMLVMDEETMLNFFGIEAADCKQVVTAVCGDGLRADEVWLIEAVDEAALARLKELADTRIAAKADETINYVPDQYAVVEKAEVFTDGLYLVLLVSPDVDALKATVEAAI